MVHSEERKPIILCIKKGEKVSEIAVYYFVPITHLGKGLKGSTM